MPAPVSVPVQRKALTAEQNELINRLVQYQEEYESPTKEDMRRSAVSTLERGVPAAVGWRGRAQTRAGGQLGGTGPGRNGALPHASGVIGWVRGEGISPRGVVALRPFTEL